MANEATEITIVLAVGVPLLSIAGVLIGVIFTNIRTRISYLEKQDSKKETRLTIIETEKKLQFDKLEQDMEELKKDMKELKKYVHEHLIKDRQTMEKMYDIINDLHAQINSK